MYGKLFASLYTGSMVGSGPMCFAVWGYVIASKDKDGFVELNPILLAATIGHCTPDDIQRCLDELCSPDERSRSKEEGGRRLVKEAEYLYRVVNAKAYDNIVKQDDRNRYMKRYMRDRRAKGIEGNDCVYCGDRASGYDHIVPICDGGLDIDSNKVPCCQSCNSSKHGIDVFEWLIKRHGVLKRGTFAKAIEEPKILLALSLHREKEQIIESLGDQKQIVNKMLENPSISISMSTSKKEEECEKEKDEKADPIMVIFRGWNRHAGSREIKDGKPVVWHEHRKVSPEIVNGAKLRLADYSVDEIVAAIDNYAQVLFDPDTFWTYVWSLPEFLTRKQAKEKVSPLQIIRFLPDNFHQDQFVSQEANKTASSLRKGFDNPWGDPTEEQVDAMERRMGIGKYKVQQP